MQNADKIDVNCLIGHWPFRKLYKNTFDDLRKVHEANGIGYGYVSSINSIFYNDPFEGDEELHNIIKGTQYKHVLTVNPLLPGYEHDIKKAVESFDIKAVRVYPGYHDYSLDNKKFLELCEVLLQYDLPLFLTSRMEDERLNYLMQPGTIDSQDVGDFLGRYPELKVVLLTFRNEELVPFKEIIAERNNILYDTSGLKNYLFAIQKSIAAIGACKITYGSLFPLFCLKSTLMLVEDDELDSGLKQKILHCNIEDFLR